MEKNSKWGNKQHEKRGLIIRVLNAYDERL